MAEIPHGFDAGKEEPVSFDVLPAAQYEVVIVESETRRTNADDGSYLALTFEVVSGDFAGRKIWVNLNLSNPSDKAVAIARGQLSSICRAVGVLRPSDSTELHNLPMLAMVGIRPERDGYPAQNRITSWKTKTDVSAVAAPARDYSALPDAKSKAAPWKRGAKV